MYKIFETIHWEFLSQNLHDFFFRLKGRKEENCKRYWIAATDENGVGQ